MRQTLSARFVAAAGIAAWVIFAYAFASSAGKDGPAEITAAMKALYNRPDSIPYPKDNPYSEAKANLGKTLFFETRLSRSQVMSCATCHNPGFDWTDGNPKGVGDYHKTLPRKVPTLFNLAWDDLFFWDGRAEGLEKQGLGPMQSATEMHMSLDEAVTRLKAIHEYAPLFTSAFPGQSDPITPENIAKAIAIFERSIISGEAPFDRWIKGDENAISAEAKHGFLLFNTKARCADCHTGWNFSDDSFHDTGVDDADIGRGKFLPFTTMQHAFKSVGLRNIERRAPYMHNGSLATLMDVINHYDHGFVKRESLADDIKPLHLSEQEKQDLVEFLKTLTSRDTPVTIPEMPK